MSQSQYVIEVGMTQRRFGQSGRSLTPVQPQQKQRLDKEYKSFLTFLPGKSFTALFVFIQKTLSFLLFGFITLIFGRRKPSHRRELPAEQDKELDRATDL